MNIKLKIIICVRKNNELSKHCGKNVVTRISIDKASDLIRLKA